MLADGEDITASTALGDWLRCLQRSGAVDATFPHMLAANAAKAEAKKTP